MFSVKFSFNEEVRRVQIAAKDGNSCFLFSELSQSARNIFPDLKGKSLSLLWKDDENDLVTVSSDQELVESVRIMETYGPSKVLRFIVRIEEGKDVSTSVMSQDVPKVKGSTVIHNGVRCDECNTVPITGIRYKCTVREDFDLCESCEAKKTQPYPVIKISDPEHAPSTIVYAFKDKNGKEVSNLPPAPAQEGGFWRPQHLAQRLGFGHPPGHGHGGRGGGWGHRHGPPGPPFGPVGPAPPSFQGPPPHHHPHHGHHSPHDHPYGHHGGRGFGGRGPSPGDGRCGPWWSQQDPQTAVSVKGAVTATANPKLDRKLEKYERKIEKIETRMAKAKSKPVLPVASASFVAGMDAETFSSPGSAASYVSVKMSDSEVQRVMDEEQELQQAIRASFEDQQAAGYGQSYTGDESDDEEVEDVDMDLVQHNAASAPEGPSEEILQHSNVYSTLSNSLSSVNTSNSIAFGVNSGAVSVASASGVSASALPPKYEMRFVRDVTFPNGTLVQPGAVFQKIWRVRNDGLYSWPEGVTLGFCGGDELCDVTVHEMVPGLEVGSEADISMTLQAPESTGRFVTYFRMETSDETKFGQRLYANIQVSDEESDWHIVKVAMPSEQQGAEEGEDADKTSITEDKATDKTVDVDASVLSLNVEEKNTHCDTFYALHSPCKVAVTGESPVSLVPGDYQEDEVNDSLEASMTLPSSRAVSRDLSAVDAPVGDLEYSEFAAELAMIDSATEALNIESASAPAAEPDTYQSTVAVLWSRELQLLGDMGFNDLDVLIPLLQTHVCTPSSLSGAQDAAPQVEGMQRVVATLLGQFGMLA